MFDLRSIPLPDLKALILVCEHMAKRGNRFFEDNFWILCGVAAQTHEPLGMNEYETEHLAEGVQYLKDAIDGLTQFADDHPGKLFLKYTLTAAHNELQRRARKETPGGVH